MVLTRRRLSLEDPFDRDRVSDASGHYVLIFRLLSLNLRSLVLLEKIDV